MKIDVHTFYKLHNYSLKNGFHCPQALKGVETPGDCWVPLHSFATLVPQEMSP
jgi:hypothetical protein